MNLQHTSFTVSDFAQAVPTEITKQRGVIQGVVHDSKAYQLKAPIGSAGLFATLPDLLTFVLANHYFLKKCSMLSGL